MVSWAVDAPLTELERYLGARARRGPEGELRVAVGDAAARAEVLLRALEGGAWVDVRVPLRHAVDVPALAALRHGGDLAIGALAIEDAQLVLRHALPARLASPEIVEEILAAFARVVREAAGLTR